MEDRKPTIWGVIWMIVGLVGMIGVILGKQHFSIILLLGTIMLIVSENNNDNDGLSTN
jgi:membrane-bound ClpP family serine protease